MPEVCYLERWGQGRCLPRSLHDKLILPPACSPLAEGDRVLVISQDCDVVHGFQDAARREDSAGREIAFRDEPYVEIMVARRTGDRDALLEKGRSPRRLQIDLRTAAGELLRFELHQRDKGLLPRKLLDSVAPDEAILPLQHGEAVLHSLRAWLAKRYSRPAFPNALELRLRPAVKVLRDKLKGDSGRSITAIFLRPHSFAELPEGEAYRLIVRIIAPDAGAENARRAAAIITGALYKCRPAVELIEDHRVTSNLVSETDFSFAEFQAMWPWDFDYLSALG